MNWTDTLTLLLKRYSQKDLAKEIGLDEATLSRLKNGKAHRVDYETGCKLVDLERKERRRLKRAAG